MGVGDEELEIADWITMMLRGALDAGQPQASQLTGYTKHVWCMMVMGKKIRCMMVMVGMRPRPLRAVLRNLGNLGK